MENIEINLTSDKIITIHELEEIHVLYQGELSDVITPESIPDFAWRSDCAYSFIGREESAVVQGSMISYLYFFA
jgi:hypothetical protein